MSYLSLAFIDTYDSDGRSSLRGHERSQRADSQTEKDRLSCRDVWQTTVTALRCLPNIQLNRESDFWSFSLPASLSSFCAADMAASTPRFLTCMQPLPQRGALSPPPTVGVHHRHFVNALTLPVFRKAQRWEGPKLAQSSSTHRDHATEFCHDCLLCLLSLSYDSYHRKRLGQLAIDIILCITNNNKKSPIILQSKFKGAQDYDTRGGRDSEGVGGVH